MIRALALSLALLLTPALCLAAKGDTFRVAITRVSDGDTVRGRVVGAQGNREVKIRLYGIDAPETKGQHWEAQPWSRKSADYLRSILPPGKVCTAKVLDVDRYGREVALLSLEGVGLIQDAILNEGLAWVYEQYCTEEPLCGKLRRVEAAAKAAKRGLWRDEDSVPPWEWRKSANGK